MKTRSILIIMIVSFATNINAQLVEWTKLFETSSFDQVGTAIVADNNRNIYITGQFGGTVDFDPFHAGVLILQLKNGISMYVN